jgi:hypothetical protein
MVTYNAPDYTWEGIANDTNPETEGLMLTKFYHGVMPFLLMRVGINYLGDIKTIRELAYRVPMVADDILPLFHGYDENGNEVADKSIAAAKNERMRVLFAKEGFWARFLGFSVNCSKMTRKEFKAALSVKAVA